MKTCRFSLLSLLLGVGVLIPDIRAAVELSEAEFVSVMNQVNFGEKETAKPSVKIKEGTPVQSGANGFAEVKFMDSSVLRLAPETQFSFASKERSISLGYGSLLMNVPHGNGGILVDAGGIKGEVTGTSLMASRDREGNFSFVILETSGQAKVTSNTGQTANLVSGQIALVRKIDGSIRVYELNLDAAVQFSPLFTSFEKPMSGLEKIEAVADIQAGEVKNETKSLLSYSDVGLKQEDPDKGPLSLLFGKSLDEMVVSKNSFLGELATAAGKEEGKDAGAPLGTVLGADSGKGGQVNDARQPEGEQIASKSNPPTGDAGGGLGGTDTAAGSEGGDLGGTDTAAGGGGAPDTQAPLAPAPVGGGVAVNQPDATPRGNN